MIYVLLNAPQILAATLAGLAVGWAWRALDGRRGAGAAQLSAGFVVTAFVAEAWLAAILAGALILAPPEAGPWVMAIGSAVVIWAGFVAPALVVTGRHRGRPWRELLAEGGHWLAVMVAQAVVLRALGLTAPPA